MSSCFKYIVYLSRILCTARHQIPTKPHVDLRYPITSHKPTQDSSGLIIPVTASKEISNLLNYSPLGLTDGSHIAQIFIRTTCSFVHVTQQKPAAGMPFTNSFFVQSKWKTKFVWAQNIMSSKRPWCGRIWGYTVNSVFMQYHYSGNARSRRIM